MVPRPCTGRPELEGWGQPPSAFPRWSEKPGRPQDAVARQWHGHRVRRPVAGEDSDGRVTQAARRFVVVHARHLAPQQPQTYTSGPAKAAEAVAEHVTRGQARWLACLPDAEAAGAAYEGRGQGRRGRRPRPWRSHAVRSRLVAATRRPRRARRGRPAQTAPPPREAG